MNKKLLYIALFSFLSNQAAYPNLLLFFVRDGFKIGVSREAETNHAMCTIKHASDNEIIWSTTRAFNTATNKFDNLEFEPQEGIPVELATRAFQLATGYFTASESGSTTE